MFHNNIPRPVCRKCGNHHDRIKIDNQRYRHINCGISENLTHLKNNTKDNTKDNTELEKALINIAVQESLEIHQMDNVNTNIINPNNINPLDKKLEQLPNNEYEKKYAHYANDIIHKKSVIKSKKIRFPQRSNKYTYNHYSDLVKINTRDESDKLNIIPDINESDCNESDCNESDFISDEIPIDIKCETNDRVNIIVGRGRNEVQGYRNLPLNNIFNNSNILYIDSNEYSDPDILGLLEDIDFTQIGFTDIITDIRIYFDWSTFYCTALPNLIKILNHFKNELNRSIKVYVPLYPDDKSLPSDVKKYLIDDNLHLNMKVMLVYGLYPLFEWDNQSRIKDMKDSINQNIYLMISTYDED
jgi:hypothetical protein